MNSKTNILKQLTALAALLLLLTLPNLILYFKLADWGKFIGSGVATSALYLLPMVLFYRKIRWWFYLLLPISLLMPIAALVALLFKDYLRSHLLLLLFESSITNQLDVIQMVFFPLLFALIAAIFLHFWLVKRLPRVLPFKVALLFSLLGATVFFGAPIARYGLKGYKSILKSQSSVFYPFYIAKDYGYMAKRITYLNSHEALIKNFKFGSTIKTPLAEKEIYIFVIGESVRSDHWGMNGYHRETTPLLALQERLVNLTDLVAGGYTTALSVPTILTRATAQNFDRAYQEKSFVAAFKEAGFKTYWLGNIASHGTRSIDIHSPDADELLFVSEQKGMDAQYDEGLVTLLDDILKKESAQKLFFVLHTAGSHFMYRDRFPDAFDKYRPSDKVLTVSTLIPEYKEYLTNGYDNSILYTDYFLDKLINKVKEQHAVSWVWYTSDHGEHLYERPRVLGSHTVPDEITLKIPGFVWTSPEYETTFPLQQQALISHKDSAYSTVNLFHSVTHMGNLTFKGDEPTKSIAHPAFKVEERWIIGLDGPEKLDWEKLKKDGLNEADFVD